MIMDITIKNSYFIKYYEKIKNGEIIAGQELITALDMYYQDLRNPKYIYDTKMAHLRIEFMERFIKLTKAPFYGQPLKLLDFQKAFIELLYSFKYAATGLDRFDEALLLIARKNAKSELCSALADAELMVGQKGSDIIVASNTNDQASILFDACETMRQFFDPPRDKNGRGKRTSGNANVIKNFKNGSKLKRMSSQSRNKEGYNAQWAVIDEIHEMKNTIVDNSIAQSQSIKINPKMISITTEGFLQNEDAALNQKLTRCRSILRGERPDDDKILIFLYTQDSEAEIWQDPETWIKSNPSLGVIKKYEYLEKRLTLSKYDNAAKVFTLAKDFNIHQGSSNAWLNIDMYTYPNKYDMEDLRGCNALAGVDLAESGDLSSASILIMKPDDPKKYIITRYFIPASKLDKDTNAGATYRSWYNDGLISISEDNENDPLKIVNWLFSDIINEYDISIRYVGYDPWHSKLFEKYLDEYGFRKDKVYQSPKSLNNAIRLVEADLRSQLIYYNENPITKWCFSNCALILNNNEQAMLDKLDKNPSRKIDGAMSIVIAYEMLRRYKDELNI